MSKKTKQRFFKATRIDGYDFFSQSILYEVGKTVRPHRTKDTPKICGAGLLHAADTPSETLVGGSWPCRLFEVEGNPVAGLDAAHPHKAGFRQLVVVKELPAYKALGPNGRAVVSLIERCKTLTPGEVREIHAARVAARDAARVAAWYAARDAARVAAWDAARVAAWDAALAIVVCDLITEDQFKTLYGPFGEVAKDVKLPKKVAHLYVEEK